MKKRQNPTDYVGSCRLAFLLKKELFQCLINIIFITLNQRSK